MYIRFFWCLPISNEKFEYENLLDYLLINIFDNKRLYFLFLNGSNINNDLIDVTKYLLNDKYSQDELKKTLKI